MNWGEAIHKLGEAVKGIAVAAFVIALIGNAIVEANIERVDRTYRIILFILPYAVGAGILGYLMSEFGKGLKTPKSKADTKD